MDADDAIQKLAEIIGQQQATIGNIVDRLQKMEKTLNSCTRIVMQMITIRIPMPAPGDKVAGEMILDHERLSRVNSALALAVTERTGQPSQPNVADHESYTPADLERAIQLVDQFWPDSGQGGLN